MKAATRWEKARSDATRDDRTLGLLRSPSLVHPVYIITWPTNQASGVSNGVTVLLSFSCVSDC